MDQHVCFCLSNNCAEYVNSKGTQSHVTLHTTYVGGPGKTVIR